MPLKLILILALPLAFYPAFFAVINGYDYLFGDARLLYWLLNGSRRDLLQAFVSDWRETLTLAYLIGLVVVLPTLLCWKFLSVFTRSLLLIIPALALAGAGLYLGLEKNMLLIAAFSGLLISTGSVTVYALLFSSR